MGPLFTRKEDRVNLTIWLSLHWVLVFAVLFVFFMLAPYFLSQYVLIIHNAMDEAIVNFLGLSLTKPILVLLIFMGGIMGLVLVNSYRCLFSELSIQRVYRLQSRQAAAIPAPFLGTITELFYDLASYLFPPPWEWGRLLEMFVVLPAAGFMLVSAAGFLVFRYWTEKREKKKIQLYRLVKEKVFVLELV